jgi:hypothetical protein
MNNGNFYGQQQTPYSGQYMNPSSAPAPMPVQQNPYPMRQEARPVFPLQMQGMGGNSSQVIWVLGEAEASSYLVAPGCEVPMFDSNGGMAYIKSVDQYNRPRLRRFRIEEIFDDVPQTRVQTPAAEYVTRQEYQKLVEEHTKLCGLMQEMAERMKGVKHDEPETE